MDTEKGKAIWAAVRAFLSEKHRLEILELTAVFAVTFLICGFQVKRMTEEGPGRPFGAQSPQNVAAAGFSGTAQAVSAKIPGREKAEAEAAAVREAYVISLGTLNVREAPSTESTIVGRFGFKDPVVITGEADQGFYPVTGIDEDTEKEISGYCYAEYLSFEAPPESHIYLSVPNYKQFDERWKDIRLGAYETMHSAGCTTTCLAMVESYLGDQTISPAGMAESISYTRDGELTFSSDYTPYRGEDALAVVYQKLWEGVPVLYSQINPSGTSHWVVVIGYTGDGENFHEGDFLINDPGSDVRYTLADFTAEYPRFNKIVFHN
ncbi:MAG: SH3 domain-containing protein [Lachnospiraceae bacterium]|nr:SH3 domain-containing protein [Lachnospiraceae bacterium]